MNKFNISYTDINGNPLSSSSNTYSFDSSNSERVINIIVRNITSEETYPRFYLTIPTSIPRYRNYIMNSSTDIIDKIQNDIISVKINVAGNQGTSFQTVGIGEINSIAGSTILPNQEKTYTLKIELRNTNVNPFVNAFNIEVV